MLRSSILFTVEREEYTPGNLSSSEAEAQNKISLVSFQIGKGAAVEASAAVGAPERQPGGAQLPVQ